MMRMDAGQQSERQQATGATGPTAPSALGAGLASALLFVVSTQGSRFEMALAWFRASAADDRRDRLFRSRQPSSARSLARFLLAHAAHPPCWPRFLSGFGAPALAALRFGPRVSHPGRATRRPPRILRPPAPCSPWRCVWRLIAALAGVAALTDFHHGFNAALKRCCGGSAPPSTGWLKTSRTIDADFDAASIKRLIILSAPAGVAASQTLLLSVNLWLAARIVDISARLGRPWPSLPENLVLPRAVAPAFVLAGAVSFYGGLAGALAGAFAAASGFALMLQGLATLHALTRESRARGFLLSALWAAVTVFFLVAPPFLLAFALFGLIESVFSLRARKARRISTRTRTE